jgi:hypothetical protein
MSKYSSAWGKTPEENAQDLAGLEAKYGEWIRNSLEQTINTLELSGDSNLVSAGLEYFKNVAISGTEEQVRELEGLISQIDMSNPIEATDLLNTKIEKGSDLVKGFSLVIQESGAGFLGVGAQFETLINNEQYEELNSNLQEIYKSQGEITESDISSLASEYSALNKMLKNTSATGSGLAKILTSIYDGKISFDAITDAVLAAVGGMDSLGESTDKVLRKLEGLELGDDFGIVQDKYTEFADMTEDWQSMGEYGNEQYENLLNYFFGSDWDVGYENNLIDRMDVLSEIVQATGEDMTYLWDNASKGMNIFGEAVPGAIQDLTELGIGI